MSSANNAHFRLIGETSVSEKVVLCRLDLDIDLTEDGTMEPGGDYRIEAGCKTIQYLHNEGAIVLLLGHLGRPKGRHNKTLSTTRLVSLLSHHLGLNVTHIAEIAGQHVRKKIGEAQPGDIFLLENVRFDPREEENDIEFAKEIASVADLYVNESFATSHRAHTSVSAITKVLPSYAGFRFAREIEILDQVLQNPERPQAAIISGAKMDTKISLLKSLIPRVDVLFTGGGIANMFLAAEGYQMGTSIMDEGAKSETEKMWKDHKDKIRIPSDAVVRREGKEGVVVALDDIRGDEAVLDIGPLTMEAYSKELSSMKTVVWNGPIGKVEDEPYRAGTKALADNLASIDAFTIAGGGDTISVLTQFGLLESFDHISSGGGAMVALLEGSPLPAVEALRSSLVGA